MRDKTNQDGLKLNGAHQLVVYADDDNILGGSIHSIKKNTELVKHSFTSYTTINITIHTIKCYKCYRNM